jgi:hypothetical protein
MKPKFYFIVCFLLLCNVKNIFSQSVAAGVEAAVTTSTVKISDIDGQTVSSIKGDGIMGYEGGFWLRLKLGPLYAKPKALFHYEQGDLDYTVNATKLSTTFSAGKILVPVLFGFKIIPPVLSLEAGPVYNYVVSATKNFEGHKVDVSKSGLGYRIGLNAEFSILNVTVSYQGVKNKSSSSLAGYETPNTFVFGVGIKL